MSQGRNAKSRRGAIIPGILLAAYLGIVSFAVYGGGEALRRYCPFAQDPACRAAVTRAIAMRHAKISLSYQMMQSPHSNRARGQRRELREQSDYIVALEERDLASTPWRCRRRAGSSSMPTRPLILNRK
jgi:hypothetical protein